MQATLDQLQRESALLPLADQAKLLESLVKRLGTGVGEAAVSVLISALAPVLTRVLETSAPIWSYLLRMRKQGLISETTYLKAGMTWSGLAVVTGISLPPATVGVGESGSVLFSWDQH
jgi:hypothetical protein